MTTPISVILQLDAGHCCSAPSPWSLAPDSLERPFSLCLFHHTRCRYIGTAHKPLPGNDLSFITFSSFSTEVPEGALLPIAVVLLQQHFAGRRVQDRI